MATATKTVSRPLGRRPDPHNESRTKWLPGIRVTPEEHAIFTQRAEGQGRSLTLQLRWELFDSPDAKRLRPRAR